MFLTCYVKLIQTQKMHKSLILQSWIFCSGALSRVLHLISFRTQKLSPVEAMILSLKGKVARRRNKEFNY